MVFFKKEELENENEKKYKFNELFWLQIKNKNGKVAFCPFSFNFSTNELYGIANGKTYKLPKSVKSLKSKYEHYESLYDFIDEYFCMPYEIYNDYKNLGEILGFYTSYEMETITTNVYSLDNGGTIAHYVCKNDRLLRDLYNPYIEWAENHKISARTLRKISKLYADDFALLAKINCNTKTNTVMKRAKTRVNHAKFLCANLEKFENENLIWI